jgi:hypothetical protein
MLQIKRVNDTSGFALDDYWWKSDWVQRFSSRLIYHVSGAVA